MHEAWYTCIGVPSPFAQIDVLIKHRLTGLFHIQIPPGTSAIVRVLDMFFLPSRTGNHIPILRPLISCPTYNARIMNVGRDIRYGTGSTNRRSRGIDSVAWNWRNFLVGVEFEFGEKFYYAEIISFSWRSNFFYGGYILIPERKTALLWYWLVADLDFFSWWFD